MWIIDLKCLDLEENAKYGRHLEINDYDSAKVAYFALVKALCEDSTKIINPFILSFSRYPDTLIFTFERKE